MFIRQTLRHVLTAGLLAVGLMSGLLAGGRHLPALVWFTALYPGMLLTEALISVLPDAANAWLIGDGDDGPAVFLSLSLIFSFLFWWVFALVLVKLWVAFSAKRSPL